MGHVQGCRSPARAWRIGHGACAGLQGPSKLTGRGAGQMAARGQVEARVGQASGEGEREGDTEPRRNCCHMVRSWCHATCTRYKGGWATPLHRGPGVGHVQGGKGG